MRRLLGSPLIIWTLEALASSKRVTNAVVSSDDHELIRLAGLYAKVDTVWRHPELAGPEVPDHPVVLDALYRGGSYVTSSDDIVVLLRPTAPFRKPEEIDAVVDILEAAPQVDSVRSVAQSKIHPRKTYLYGQHLVPYTSDHKANHPSQSLEPVCYATGFIDAVRARVVLDEGNMEGQIIAPWLTPLDRSVDLDTELDWLMAEKLAKEHNWGPGAIL
jgi:CMP-N-acetylneuraminic acid synthetase